MPLGERAPAPPFTQELGERDEQDRPGTVRFRHALNASYPHQTRESGVMDPTDSPGTVPHPGGRRTRTAHVLTRGGHPRAPMTRR
ncbi:hypothetical protein GCM10009800_21770 [Nocardiopsis rhodophaea]